uniref:ankyrin repeat domain-containing protein 54 n=1 Tax=Myxine glutinosa TaxID=7769 RepID=UPI00358FA41B
MSSGEEDAKVESGLVQQSAAPGKARPPPCRRTLRPSPLAASLRGQRRLRDAASAGDAARVRSLLDEHGAEPGAADSKGRTALHFAACAGDEATVRLLVERGADANRRDSLGNTPLHLAACSHRSAVVTALLRAGARPDAADGAGRTPLQLARGKLALLQRPPGSERSLVGLRAEVQQILSLLRAYAEKMGRQSDCEVLGELVSRLHLTTTRGEVDAISDLLAGFTNLSLQRENECH